MDLINSNSENIKVSGIDVMPISMIEIADLYPLGRIAIYTEKAIKELGERKWN